MDSEHDDEVISRRYLLEDRLRGMMRRCAPDMVMLSEAERDASLRATLAARPDAGGGAWLFCYGSLVWNPTIRADARQVATIDGWHRAFCLRSQAGRGTASNPGVLLGLKPGGSCTGLALHIAEDMIDGELGLLWRREMMTGAYVPKWLGMRDMQGSALAFTIDTEHDSFIDWPESRIVTSLATAAGEVGTNAEYLFRTRDGLRTRAIFDPVIERLADAVAALQGTMA